MKSYRLDIDVLFDGDDNNPAISSFIESFGSIVYTGKGGPSKFLGGLKIDPDFSLKCIVGIPEEEFSHPKKSLVEAYCQHILGADIFKQGESIWTTERHWQPTNKNRSTRGLGLSLIDVEWMTSLGLVRGRWENYVLMVSNSILTRQDKLPNREDMFIENTRMLLALASYGFIDPWQFFTDNKHR